jgi:hypothetical protein
VLSLNGCQEETFELEPGLLSVNWQLEDLNITWCPRLIDISEHIFFLFTQNE